MVGALAAGAMASVHAVHAVAGAHAGAMASARIGQPAPAALATADAAAAARAWVGHAPNPDGSGPAARVAAAAPPPLTTYHARTITCDGVRANCATGRAIVAEVGGDGCAPLRA